MLSVVFGLGYRLWTQRSEPAVDPLVEALPVDTDLSLQDIHYTETSGGLPRWTLTAKSAAYDAGQGKSAVQNVRLEFFDKQGKEQMVLTADQGFWLSETGEIEVQGNVVITTNEGYIFHTEQLHYFSKVNELTTDESVQVNKGPVKLTATGMRYRLKDRFLRLNSQVRATFVDGIGNH